MNHRTLSSRSIRMLAIGIAIFFCSSLGAHAAGAGPPNMPPAVRITCPMPTPLSEFQTIPALTIHWEGQDPDGSEPGLPVQYKFILLGPSSEFPVSLAVSDPDSLRRYYANHPLGPWAGWDSTGNENPSTTFNDLVPNAHFLFAVIAFDGAGDYSPNFSLSTNMLRFVVSYAGYLGPVITLTGPGLDYRYHSGGYCPCSSAEVPVDVAEGQSPTFGWSAFARTACDSDSVVWYRWTLDIDDLSDQTPRIDEETDLAHWSAPSPETRSATLPPFQLANPNVPHRLYIEAEDKVGVRSLGIIKITIVPSNTGVDDAPGSRIELSAARPNPFSARTSFRFSLARAGRIRLGILDAQGRRVARLVGGEVSEGEHTVIWNGVDGEGHRCADGIYFVQLETDQGTLVRRIVLAR